MIVRQFLNWVRTAPAAERANATSALARAYLYSDLSIDDRIAAEGAMAILLDDPSPLVRMALARALASSADAPPSIITALAGEQPEIATVVLEHSPLLLDSELVDAVGQGHTLMQEAIARRVHVPCAVSAAIGEVGTAEACLALLDNARADIVPFTFDRIAERHGQNAAVREALFAREDLPAPTRQALVVQLSRSLMQFVTERDWLDEQRAAAIAREACAKATLALAAFAPRAELRRLVSHLRQSGELTAGLILRALLSGHIALFEDALAELSGLPAARVAALIHNRRGLGLDALFRRAGLPASTHPAFRAALAAMAEIGFAGDPGGAARLKRRMVERVLTACTQDGAGEISPLLVLLRRFAAEAAREEARLYCDELVAADEERRLQNAA